MPEQAFNGTVLEGRERRYTVINERDVKNYLDKRTQERLVKDLDFPLHEIQLGRIANGKNPYNCYIVINVDEPYVDEIIAVMKKHGHWEGYQSSKMKYFEVSEPYYALLKAKNRDDALLEYNASVAGLEDIEEVKEVERDYALFSYSSYRADDVLSFGEFMEEFNDGSRCILIIDSALR